MKYEEYRPTGTTWVESVPATWDCKKISALFSQRKTKVSDADYPALSVTKIGVVPQLTNVAKSDDSENRKLVCTGDFVINSRSDRKGSCGISRFDGSISLINLVLIPHRGWNNRYVHYLLRSQPFSEEYYRYGRGIVADLWTTRYSEMKNILLPVPPRDEQDQIVRYLDWQVSKINKLIAAKKKQITLLREQKQNRINDIVLHGINPAYKMKESGIEYIGTVPEHWLVLLNHRIFISVTRKFDEQETVLSLSQKDGLIPYEIMTERSLHTASYDNWQLVLENDLVLNRFKAHLGVFFASHYRGIVTFHYGVYSPRIPLVAKYYEALYHTPIYRRVYAGQSRGMTVGLQNLSDTNFFNTYTLYPPFDEQKLIVTEIEKIESQYVSIEKKVTMSIDDLQEFRSCLISDVVTGQIDVRDVVIPENEPVEENASEVECADDEFGISEVEQL